MDKSPPGGARNHHFVPQYYLKGFATPRSKDGWLSVFDLKEQKSFKTRPRNVAARRDYHRVDIDGVDPNIVETQLATLDDQADKAFRRVIAARSIADRDDFSFLLTLIHSTPPPADLSVPCDWRRRSGRAPWPRPVGDLSDRREQLADASPPSSSKG